MSTVLIFFNENELFLGKKKVFFEQMYRQDIVELC